MNEKDPQKQKAQTGIKRPPHTDPDKLRTAILQEEHEEVIKDAQVLEEMIAIDKEKIELFKKEADYYEGFISHLNAKQPINLFIGKRKLWDLVNSFDSRDVTFRAPPIDSDLKLLKLIGLFERNNIHNQTQLNKVITEVACLIENNIPETIYLSKCHLKYSHVQMLCKSLKNNTTLTFLDLSDNQLNNESADALIEMLKFNTTLNVLYLLGDNHISVEKIDLIDSIMAKRAEAKRDADAQSTLRMYFEDQYKFGASYVEKKDFQEAIKYFEPAAQQGSANAQFSLGECYLYGQGVTRDLLKAIDYFGLAAKQGHEDAEDALAKYDEEARLMLQFSQKGMKDLEQEVNDYQRRLAELNLKKTAQINNDASIQKRKLENFIRNNLEGEIEMGSYPKTVAIEGVSQTMTLYNRVRFDEMIEKEIGNLIKDNISEDIALRECQLQDFHIHTLCKSLGRNTSLKNLDLHGNDITKAGVLSLAKALKINTTLIDLNLGNNEIDNDGAEALIEMLRVNTTLKKLRISKNKMSEDKTEEIKSIMLGRSLMGVEISPFCSPISQSVAKTINVPQSNLATSENADKGSSLTGLPSAQFV